MVTLVFLAQSWDYLVSYRLGERMGILESQALLAFLVQSYFP